MSKVKKKVKKVKKKRSRFKSKNFRILLIVIVLMYFLAMGIPALRGSTAKTIAVENGQIIDSTKSKGIISKDEIVYKSEAKGNIVFSVKEGEKISKNAKIAEIKTTTYSGYTNDLEEVDIEIEEYNKRISSQKEILKGDIQKNQGEIDEIVKEVQKNVAEQNYEEVKRLKDELLIISDKKDAITSEKSLVMEQLEVAMKKKSEIINKVKQSNIIYAAEQAGIVSRVIDGFEDDFSSKNIDKYDVNDFKVLEVEKKAINEKEELEIGSNIFKIIEDQNWYIMTKIEGESLEKLKKGNVVSVNINKNTDKIDATIVKIDRSKEDVFLILEMDKHLHDFYKERYVDLRVIKNVYSGLKIPQDSIIEKDGTKGVFIKDISGVVKFRPVKIVKKTQYTTLVEPVEGQTPLKLFDEVFTDGKKVKEGQLVNSKGGN